MALENFQLWTNDLDRTLLDTDRAFDVLVDVSQEVGGIKKDVLLQAKVDTESSGGSFDVFGYLADRDVDNEILRNIFSAFVMAGNKASLLYDDAEPFLTALTESVFVEHMILTYGAIGWQYAKINAAGLSEVPFVVTGEKHKGLLIANSRQADGRYKIAINGGEALSAFTVVITDDKAASFKGLPANCRGIWVVREGKQLRSQSGDVPENVVRVSGLLEALEVVAPF